MFVKEFLEKLQIERMLEKVNTNPIVKLAGLQQASTMHIRNAVILCAEKKEAETLYFLRWCVDGLDGILEKYEEDVNAS